MKKTTHKSSISETPDLDQLHANVTKNGPSEKIDHLILQAAHDQVKKGKPAISSISDEIENARSKKRSGRFVGIDTPYAMAAVIVLSASLWLLIKPMTSDPFKEMVNTNSGLPTQKNEVRELADHAREDSGNVVLKEQRADSMDHAVSPDTLSEITSTETHSEPAGVASSRYMAPQIMSEPVLQKAEQSAAKRMDAAEWESESDQLIVNSQWIEGKIKEIRELLDKNQIAEAQKQFFELNAIAPELRWQAWLSSDEHAVLIDKSKVDLLELSE